MAIGPVIQFTLYTAQINHHFTQFGVHVLGSESHGACGVGTTSPNLITTKGDILGTQTSSHRAERSPLKQPKGDYWALLRGVLGPLGLEASRELPSTPC